jgi:hypothetical protein
MSQKVQQYRDLAEEAQRRASEAEHARTKDMYEKLASTWRDLAERIEREPYQGGPSSRILGSSNSPE